MTIKEANEQINDAPENELSSGAGGEDDASTEIEGDDSHLHDDQKSRPLGG
ncbi:hypothetical protein [Sphingomonas aerophila]|jgi:hypothetical protein|uniref:Uncharacterized protein n=1 Tax=Sphingomonas aerophila TaxID=1344948 RepID=A0A7W9BH22_9SPHN|nr:hypothetical protein [Sphingomonas aerophila]MBB5717002.1 hypothetical protein [Sphingomonas aerophila]